MEMILAVLQYKMIKFLISLIIIFVLIFILALIYFILKLRIKRKSNSFFGKR